MRTSDRLERKEKLHDAEYFDKIMKNYNTIAAADDDDDDFIIFSFRFLQLRLDVRFEYLFVVY